jgi:hypothetical protein
MDVMVLIKMSAERWMKELEIQHQVRQHLQAKEKAQAVEQEEIRQDAERRAWLRELRHAKEIFGADEFYSNNCKEVVKMDENIKERLDGYLELLNEINEKTQSETATIALLQEISKDQRVEKMIEERQARNNEPATFKQRKFMDDLGIKYPKNVTKQEASALIDGELAKNGNGV